MLKKLSFLFLFAFLLFTFAQSCYADDPNLVGWYTLDESSGTVAADSSVKHNNGTVSGAVWAPTEGKIGGALTFTGQGNNKKVNVPATHLKAAKGTVCLWVRIEGSQLGVRYAFSHITSGTNRIRLYCDSSTNQLDIGLGGNQQVASNVATFAPDTWYHIALTWNGGSWNVYVNGAYVTGGTYSGLATIGSNFHIGNSNYEPVYEGWLGKLDDVRIFDRALNASEIAAVYEPLTPKNPSPADGTANAGLGTTLSWTAGEGATAHNVYFGTNAGSLPLVSAAQPETTYVPASLQLGTTYFWRIEEISSQGTTSGGVWSFTTDTGRATNPNPTNGYLFAELDAVLSWSAGVSSTSHDVYMGTSPGSLIMLQGGLSAASFDPGGLNPGITYYWRIDEHNAAGVVTGTLWNFKTVGPAYNPNPADAAVNVVLDAVLSWTAGIASGTQDVYFSTSFADVNSASRPAGDINRSGQVDYADVSLFVEQWLGSGSADLDGSGAVNLADWALLANGWLDSIGPAFKGNQPVGNNSYDPVLGENITYYWRIDEVKGSTIYRGDVWSFTTQIPPLPAFPGAEGWGTYTPGGRGGQVIHVTNLNSSGPGSLNAACQTAGPRIVVFDVSGVIQGQVRITQPYLTIAGQTAPGGGITVVGMVTSYNWGPGKHDIVIRHIRVRPPPEGGASGDGFQMGGMDEAYNVVLDHCSVSWAIDETIDFYWGHDMTVQWCTIEESDPLGHPKGEGHNFGIISAAEGSGAVSTHHNVWAHHYRRVPCMAPYRQNAADDFRNNLIYDCYGGYTDDGHGPGIQSPINLLYNYTKRGPSCWDRIYPFATVNGVNYYIHNNWFEGWGLQGHPRYWTWGSAPAWVQFNNNGNELTSPGYVPPITTHPITDQASATALYNLLLQKAGAWPRDRVTTRTIDEVINGTGSYGRHADAYPSAAWFMEGLTPTAPPPDTDGDGMPDTWEVAHGLNPNNSADRNNIVPAGASPGDRHRRYTYIEYYINELADNLVP